MTNKLTRMSRRSFLQTAGTVLALPFLESALPRQARAAATSVAQRLILFHVPCGVNTSTWFPSSFGTSYALPPSLQPLSPFQKDILVFSNMQNSAALASPANLHGRHSTGLVGLYSGTVFPTNETQASPAITGITVDQIYANAIQGMTSVPSLQLGVRNDFDCDDISPCPDISNLSWANPTTPLSPMTNPQAVFDTFFVGPDATATAADKARRRSMRQSVLDTVMAQSTSLKTKLGRDDGQKLDQYFSAVRDVETQLLGAGPAASCDGTRPPTVDPNDYPTQYALMMKLMVLAVQCDLTRAISFFFGPGHCGHLYSFLPGITDVHHSYSHHDNDPTKLAALTTITTWEMTIFAQLLQGLKSVNEGSGTLLDNTVITLTSEVTDGNMHNYDHVPFIVAGGGGGFITPGRSVDASVSAGLSDTGSLFYSILRGLGAAPGSFGELNVNTPFAFLKG